MGRECGRLPASKDELKEALPPILFLGDPQAAWERGQPEDGGGESSPTPEFGNCHCTLGGSRSTPLDARRRLRAADNPEGCRDSAV